MPTKTLTQPMSLNEILAANIRSERERRSLTQQQLAIKLGRPRPRISEAESASTDCRLSTLQAYAEAFGIPASRLLMQPKV